MNAAISLQPDSAVPLYYQLEQALRSQIQSGVWKPGDMITSERELMQAAGVSRATVRQAISNLINEGVLERMHGRGTFVAHRKLEQEMRSVYSFAEQMARQGVQLEDRLLQRHQVPAAPDLANLLAVAPGSPLIHIRRVRYLRDVPLMLDSSYVPYHLCPTLLIDPFEPPLYKMLAERYDLAPTHCTDFLEPVLADRAQAHLLAVEPGAPLMFLERLTFTRGDVPLHVARNYIPGSRSRFRVNLWSDSAEAELKGGLQTVRLNFSQDGSGQDGQDSKGGR
ncbi:MAG: GntR family transcriptional regulator [Chloroflexota bacterium]